MKKSDITNFGAIKSLIIQYSYDSSKKNIVREFYQMVKKSPILKKQFQVFYNLENKSDLTTESAIRYIDANIGILKEYSKDILLRENNKLNRFSNGKCVASNLQNDIHSLIVETVKDVPNIDKLHNSFEVVLESVTAKGVDNSEMIKLYESIVKENNFDLFLETALIKYKEKYSDLDEYDNMIIETFSIGDKSKITETHSIIRDSIVTKLRDKIKESYDPEEKLACYQTIEKITLTEGIELDLDNVIELNELRKTLNN